MQDIRIALPHLTITGIQFGQTDKPLVLALHGWLDNAATFTHLAPMLEDYCVVALDLPGHGMSSHRSPDAHYHQMDFVQDIHACVVEQGWSDVILLGHSMGGILGSIYAAVFPERVKCLISIEAFGPLTEHASTSTDQLRRSIESRLSMAHREAKHPEDFESAVRARALAGDMGREAARILVERNIEEREGQLSWRTDRRLRTISSLRLTEEQAEAILNGIACPMLLIHGEQGFEKVKANAERRQGWVKSLTRTTCPGGHHLHLEAPLDVAEQIIYFLNNQ
ncbi:alpha/beta hydrolase [Aestuariibacter halophilus]|uniref:Alpha/beta hydrolase n=1 Tax=Fluctibacter halophilus TaxID=226011 RepID=A0ABS8GAK5_9ALTE|nr:alpha/beta hydrolase [Aestuariibacter halophilus]MCC2616261.1 alpha/beta hydrolase [Aestuariibacter halophilus]